MSTMAQLYVCTRPIPRLKGQSPISSASTDRSAAPVGRICEHNRPGSFDLGKEGILTQSQPGLGTGVDKASDNDTQIPSSRHIVLAA